MKENPFGQESILKIQAAVSKGNTYLKELAFTAPFKVMAPFQREKGGIETMVLTASAGIMEGDVQRIEIETLPGARLSVTAQAFEKVHRMKEGSASRRTRLHVGKDSILSYRPLPVIPFGDSAFENRTEIYLEGESSRMIYEEILSCGRAASGERFVYRSYDSLVQVWCGKRLIYRENAIFCPKKMPMEGIGMFEGYSHMASLLLFHLEISRGEEEKIRRLIETAPEICGGVTRTAANDLVVRAFGNRAQQLQEICNKICLMEQRMFESCCSNEKILKTFLKEV